MKRFLERLGAYGKALNTLQQVLWNPSKPIFPNGIAISVLPSRRKKFRKPKLEKLASFVMTEEELKSFEFDPDISGPYEEATARVDLKEHCEILLARFYIEDSNRVPVIDYLSVSKLSCFLCSEFLKHLGGQDLAGKPAKFHVRGEHGKVYGKWIPPNDIQGTEEVTTRVLASLRSVDEDIQTRVRQRLKRTQLNLTPGGESPGWSSDESSDGESPDENSKDSLPRARSCWLWQGL